MGLENAVRERVDRLKCIYGGVLLLENCFLLPEYRPYIYVFSSDTSEISINFADITVCANDAAQFLLMSTTLHYFYAARIPFPENYLRSTPMISCAKTSKIFNKALALCGTLNCLNNEAKVLFSYVK